MLRTPSPSRSSQRRRDRDSLPGPHDPYVGILATQPRPVWHRLPRAVRHAGDLNSEVDKQPAIFGGNVFLSTRSGTLIRAFTASFSSETTGVEVNLANGHLFFSDDDAAEVYEVAAGNDGAYGTGDDVITHFDTAVFGGTDVEGVAFDMGMECCSWQVAGTRTSSGLRQVRMACSTAWEMW